MEQHDMGGTHRREDVLDTVAFGSMLVFASVMPPLDPDAVETDSQGTRQRSGEDDLLDISLDEMSTRGSGGSFAP